MQPCPICSHVLSLVAQAAVRSASGLARRPTGWSHRPSPPCLVRELACWHAGAWRSQHTCSQPTRGHELRIMMPAQAQPPQAGMFICQLMKNAQAGMLTCDRWGSAGAARATSAPTALGHEDYQCAPAGEFFLLFVFLFCSSSCSCCPAAFVRTFVRSFVRSFVVLVLVLALATW